MTLSFLISPKNFQLKKTCDTLTTMLQERQLLNFMIFIKLQINLSFQTQFNITPKDEIKIYKINSSDIGMLTCLSHFITEKKLVVGF